jgi:segregation and condensation protein A
MIKPSLVLEKFSGPLDLLLGLLGEKKLSISELSLSKVTEQYLLYLDKLEKNKVEELADFLVVGSSLLLLKSKALLPQFAPDEDDGPSLEEQLRIYKNFIEASKKVNQLWLGYRISSFRIEPPRKSENFVSPTNLSSTALYQSMLQLVSRLKPLKPLPETMIDKAISMKEKLDQIRNYLKKRKQIGFYEIINNSRNKTDVIVSFLALLELVKQKTVFLEQEQGFGDIIISKVA